MCEYILKERILSHSPQMPSYGSHKITCYFSMKGDLASLWGTGNEWECFSVAGGLDSLQGIGHIQECFSMEGRWVSWGITGHMIKCAEYLKCLILLSEHLCLPQI